MNEQKFTEALHLAAKDEAFVEAACTAADAETFANILRTHGVEIGDEDAAQMYSMMQNQKSGELSEEDLDDVAGGFFAPAAWAAAGGVAFLVGTWHGFRKKKKKK